MNATLRKPMLIASWSLPDTTGLGGALAGGLTGTVTLLLSPLVFALHGMSAWTVPHTLAALVLGNSALAVSGFPALLIGTLLYLAVAILLGACFGLVYRRLLGLTTDFGLPLYLGLIYGLMLFLLAYFVALPALDPTLVAADAAIGPMAALAASFGLGQGLFYSIVRPLPYTQTAELRSGFLHNMGMRSR